MSASNAALNARTSRPTESISGLTEALLHPLRTATPPLLDPADDERIPAHRPSMTTRALLTPRIPPASDAGESLSAQRQHPLTDDSRSPATKTLSRSLASDSLPGRSTDSIPAQTSTDAVASTFAFTMSGVQAGAGGDAGVGCALLPKLRLGLLTVRARSPPLMIDGSQSDRLWECGNVPSKDTAWCRSCPCYCFPATTDPPPIHPFVALRLRSLPPFLQAPPRCPISCANVYRACTLHAGTRQATATGYDLLTCLRRCRPPLLAIGMRVSLCACTSVNFDICKSAFARATYTQLVVFCIITVALASSVAEVGRRGRRQDGP